MRRMTSLALALALALAIVVAACAADDFEALPDCRVSMLAVRWHTQPIPMTDLLFVVDDSASMVDEQASLTVQLPTLVSVLVTGDRDRDGIPEFPPVQDLHVAVVTTDLGSGGSDVPSCGSAAGDDALLRTRGNTSSAGCMETYPPFLTFVPGEVEPTRFAADLACVGRVGTAGCGIEQPLEAALEALTPSTSALRFAGGALGHGDRENAGFLRDGSTIVVIALTDEDDCSLADPTRADRSTWASGADPNVGCAADPAALHPIARYVDGFRALRADNPDLVVFGAITGVPPDMVTDTARLDYDALLADERMQDRALPGPPPEPWPACDVPGRGRALPARRITQVAQRLAPNAVVQSICQEDFSAVLDDAIPRYACADSFGAPWCLPWPPTPDADGRVLCRLTEVRPASGAAQHCGASPGRSLLRMSDPSRGEPAGREVCLVTQSPGGTASGWYYDASPGDRCPGRVPQRIAFTPDVVPPPDTEIVLECVAETCVDPGG